MEMKIDCSGAVGILHPVLSLNVLIDIVIWWQLCLFSILKGEVPLFPPQPPYTQKKKKGNIVILSSHTTLMWSNLWLEFHRIIMGMETLWSNRSYVCEVNLIGK